MLFSFNMLKYLLYILIFNTTCFAQPFDVLGNSDHKTVKKVVIKRNIENEGRERIPVVDVQTVKKDLEDHITADAHNNHLDDSAKANQKYAKGNTGEIKPVVEKEDRKPNSTVVDDSQMPGVNIVKKFNDENTTNLFPVFYVFVGCSVLVLIFFVVRSFRLRPGAPATATVRKYGIVGRRSDMEMLPLPLAEEEDDDTLFDMGTQINR